MFRKLRTSLTVLRRVPETSLAYLYGEGATDNATVLEITPGARSVCESVLRFLKLLRRNIRLRSTPDFPACEILIFAGTYNQLVSLLPTIEALSARKIRYNLVTWGQAATMCVNESRPLKFNCMDVMCALLLFAFRAPGLLARLSAEGNKNKKQHAWLFFESYAFLPCVSGLLDKVHPKCVLVANDHSAPNRCLIETAYSKAIKTAYIQHASVSEAFPPLAFDYAFLDGANALYIYNNINEAASIKLKERSGACVIFLTGQQKKIIKNKTGGSDFIVGVGANALDDIDLIEKLSQILIIKGLHCIIRTHPAASTAVKQRISDFVSTNPKITLSDGKQEGVGIFLSKIDCVLAGDTSLHLEAALAGLPTFYFKLSHSSCFNDYYGFVKTGVSIPLQFEDISVENDSLQETLKSTAENRAGALKYFSETYGTPYQGKEGECVATALGQLLGEEQIGTPFFLKKHTSLVNIVYGLSNSD